MDFFHWKKWVEVSPINWKVNTNIRKEVIYVADWQKLYSCFVLLVHIRVFDSFMSPPSFRFLLVFINPNFDMLNPHLDKRQTAEQ